MFSCPLMTAWRTQAVLLVGQLRRRAWLQATARHDTAQPPEKRLLRAAVAAGAVVVVENRPKAGVADAVVVVVTKENAGAVAGFGVANPNDVVPAVAAVLAAGNSVDPPPEVAKMICVYE